MIRVTTKVDEADCRVTRVRINGRVDVGATFYFSLPILKRTSM